MHIFMPKEGCSLNKYIHLLYMSQTKYVCQLEDNFKVEELEHKEESLRALGIKSESKSELTMRVPMLPYMLLDIKKNNATNLESLTYGKVRIYPKYALEHKYKEKKYVYLIFPMYFEKHNYLRFDVKGKNPFSIALNHLINHLKIKRH